MLARLSWAPARTAFVLIGAAFVSISLLGACLDYAGEDRLQGCDTGPADAGVSGSGSGSGATPSSGSSAEPSDCGVDAPAPAPGSGSGSGA